MTAAIERVGFVGLGNIGGPMARRIAGRFETVVFDLSEEAVASLVEAGAKAGTSCRDVGARSQVIGVCVVNDAGTRAVVAGPDGLLEGAEPGTVIAIHSTIHPDTARELGEAAAARGVEIVDAQMTGGAAGAEGGTLRYMVGGSDAALERVRPVLEASAGEITHCGGLGMGAVAKLCNNLAQFQAWQGYVEAQRLALAAGLSNETFLELLSWILNDNARAFLAGRGALESDPDNAFLGERLGAGMRLADKDLSLALEVARDVGVSMPGTALCQQSTARLFGVADRQKR